MATINQVNVGLSSASGTGAFVGTSAPSISSPTLVTPILGTPSSGDLINCTNLQWGTNNSAGVALRFVSGTISSAQILALNASPVQVIAPAGATSVILVESYAVYFIYNSVQYTAAAAQVIRLTYGSAATPSIVATMISNAALVGTTNVVSLGQPPQQGSLADSVSLNTGVYFKNPIATEISAGNSTINYYIWYKIIDVSTL